MKITALLLANAMALVPAITGAQATQTPNMMRHVRRTL